MKTVFKKLFVSAGCIFALAALFAVCAFAENIDFFASFEYIAGGDGSEEVKSQIAPDGERYFFLPSCADFADITLRYDGDAPVILRTENASQMIESGVSFDLTALFKNTDAEELSTDLEYEETTDIAPEYTQERENSDTENKYTVTVSVGEEEFNLTFMKSGNVRAMFIVSDNALQGRAWVDSAKGNEATGKLSIISADGETDYSGELTSIKGRGNSTFTEYIKKPYQIKLSKKNDLIGGTKEEANKKWVLLANAAESTLIHNSTTFALANLLGMPYTPQYEAVDLYYDGEYRGAYMLTEKTEVGSSRIDISDTDELIEDLNADTDAYENPVVVTKTIASRGETAAKENSAGSYKYVSLLAEPELPEGARHHAYLLEIDFTKRWQAGQSGYVDELSGFMTKRSQAVVTKNPEYLTKETGAYISAFWQEFEDAVYSEDGYNKTTGKYYYEYCDLDSLVKLYLINELGKNYDAFTSSAYFYLPEDSDIMYAGPVWDYDLCYGIGHNNRDVASNPENFFASEKYLINGLIKTESFRDALKKTLNKSDGEFYLAVQQLLGSGGIIASQASVVSVQQELNFIAWDIFDDDYFYYSNNYYPIVVTDGDDPTWENSVKFFESFISERVEWLADEVGEWHGETYAITTDSGTKRYSSFSRLIEKLANTVNSITIFLCRIFE